MIDYANLTHEEMNTLCGWIGETAFKNYFEKNQRTLVRIYRDCRAKKLSMAQICDIVYRNRADKFIVNILDDCSNQLITIGKKLMEEKIASGDDEETAFVQMLAESPFIDNLPLYYKLKEEERSEDYIRMTIAAVTLLMRKKDTESESEEEKTVDVNLQAQLEDQSRRTAELEHQLEASLAESEQVKKALASYQIKEKRLHQARRSDEDYENPDYQFLSICRVTDYRLGDNPHSLERLADVINGNLVPFEEDPTMPRMYANRDRLFIKDGPDKIDYYGVWNWKALENWSDPTKDYVITKYNSKCFPVEIVEAPEYSSLQELVSALNNGISDSVFSNRMLWCFRSAEGYIGVLVERKQLIYKGDRLFVAPNTIELPVYVISTDDTTLLGSKQKMLLGENPKLFLRRIDPGVPDDFIKLYDPIDLMRKMLLDRASWSATKASGMTRSQWQQFRSFLEKISTEGLLEEFCSTCGCSKEEAEQYLSTFLSRADQYLDGKDLPTATLIHAIQSSEKLSAYCADLIRDAWEKKHYQEMTEAQQALKQVQGEVLREKAQLIDVRGRKEAIEVELREKESLAEGVEKRIADRIAAAKKDAAQFISDMAFCSATAVSPQSNISIVSEGIQAEIDTTIILENPDDLLDHMRYELSAAGVDDEYSLFMAAFLYSAYCNKTPLLLSGPNAGQIANAFAVCITGSTAAAVDCNQDYTANWAEELNAIHSDIVAIRNPFRHDWIHPIIEKLEMPDKFFLLLHPFADDLCIEPAGLMNYVLPVLTEAFVTGKATGNYTGAVFFQDFAHHKPEKTDKRIHSAMLKKLFSQAVLRSSIQQLLTDAHVLVPEMNDDVDLLFGIIPAAFILGKCEALLSDMEDLQSDTKQSHHFLRAIMGKDE